MSTYTVERAVGYRADVMSTHHNRDAAVAAMNRAGGIAVVKVQPTARIVATTLRRTVG